MLPIGNTVVLTWFRWRLIAGDKNFRYLGLGFREPLTPSLVWRSEQFPPFATSIVCTFHHEGEKCVRASSTDIALKYFQI
jgi:hypothetical protein